MNFLLWHFLCRPFGLREETTVKHPTLTLYEKWVPKSVTLPHTGTSAPLPPQKNEKLTDLELSSQVGLQFSKCHSTPPPPPPDFKVPLYLPRKWKVSSFGTFKSSWASNFKVPLHFNSVLQRDASSQGNYTTKSILLVKHSFINFYLGEIFEHSCTCKTFVNKILSHT